MIMTPTIQNNNNQERQMLSSLWENRRRQLTQRDYPHLPGQSAGDMSKQSQWMGAALWQRRCWDRQDNVRSWGPQQEYRERGSHSWSGVWKGSPGKVPGILCHSDTRPHFPEGLISAGFMWHGWVSACPFIAKKMDGCVLRHHQPSGLEASQRALSSGPASC